LRSCCTVDHGHQVVTLVVIVTKLQYCWWRSPSGRLYNVGRGHQVAVQLVKVLKPIYYWSASCCSVDSGNQATVHILLVQVSKLLYFLSRSPHGCVVGQGLELFAKLLYFWLRSQMSCTVGQGLQVAVLLDKVLK